MLIFVYGTLKKDCSNHNVLKKINAKFIDNCKTKDKYPMYKSENYFPYLENQKGVGKHITGELYHINNSKEKVLDEFEGVPNLYKSGTLTIIDSSSKEIEVSVYFKSKETELSNKKLINNWIEKSAAEYNFMFDNYYSSILNE